MPTDIIGSEILQDADGGSRAFEFVPGPVFANLILADEINRTPPKTQAALLEAMQEKQVTVTGTTTRAGGAVHRLRHPEPDRARGHLPAARGPARPVLLQPDHRLPEHGRGEADRAPAPPAATLPERAAGARCRRTCSKLQDAVLDVPVPDHVLDYVLQLVARHPPGRRPTPTTTSSNYVAWGAGPRASQNLVRAARALALLRGQAAASRRGSPRRRRAGAAPPHHPELQRHRRGRQRRGHHPTPAGKGMRDAGTGSFQFSALSFQ